MRTSFKRLLGFIIPAAVISSSLLFTTASAQETPHFEGKTINVNIRVAPGGGYDFHGRLLARHIGKHIPGNPNVIPRNRPGAGGIVAANHLYEQGNPDGTDILIAARELALAQALGTEGVRYDVREMPALGSTSNDNRVWMTLPDAGIEGLQDLENYEGTLSFAVAGISAGSGQMVQLLEIAGYPAGMVTGFPDPGDQLLAMLRGDTSGMTGTYPGRKDMIESENLQIFAKLGNHPDLESYDDIRDHVEGDVLALANILAAPLVAGRPFFAAPGTPDDVLHILRTAFEATLNDPDYIAELNAAGEEVGFTGPEEMEEAYRETLNAPDRILDIFRGD